MPRRITPRTTLDNLRKEAKRWLKALRDNDADARARFDRALADAPKTPTLRAVQLALAREYGLPGWSAFKEAVELAHYEEMAANLLEAYRTGTPEAMRRHWRDTWHQRAWPAMRRYVLLDLGRVPGVDDAYIDISLDDARLHVAKEQRFDSWEALRTFVTSLPPEKRRTATARPVGVFASIDGKEEDAVRTMTRDWDDAVAILESQRMNGIAAHGQMTDGVLERLSHAPSITMLHLGGCKELTDDGVRHLARMPQLRMLDVSGTQVTDRGLAVLRQLPALERINLNGTLVTDAGAAELRHCPALQRVDLAWTHTGDGAVRALAGMADLHHFHSGTLLSDAGLPLFHEWPRMKRWHGGDGALELTSPDDGPNGLTLRGTLTDRGLASLVGLDGLFGLNIDDAGPAISARGLAPLASLPHLGRFAFDVHDDTMPYIAAFPALRFLMCQDTDAGDAGWIALSRSRTIESIWGRRCHGLRAAGFRALATMPALRNLSVSCLNVDDDALSLLPAFPALRELMPMDVPDEGYRHIGRCERLERLVLMYCRDTTDRATEHIAGLGRLTKYFASYTQITDRTPALLSGVTSLEDVAFSGCAALTNSGVAALLTLPRLRKLAVDGSPGVTADALGRFAREA